MRLLSRAARLRYGLDELSVASSARVRQLAHAINQARGGTPFVHAGELEALRVLEQLLTGALEHGLDTERDAALDATLAALEKELGREGLSSLLAGLEKEFDAAATESMDSADSADRRPRDAATERRAVLELFVLWQLNRNPALAAVRELIDDRALAPDLYDRAMATVERQLRTRTSRGVPLAGDLIDLMEAPARAQPESIAGQLALYLDQPTEDLGVAREELERVLDSLAEERPRLPPGPPGPPPESERSAPEPVVYARPPREEPRWMRELVLGARNAHVWLDQLARSTGREIARLDQVPEAELARLAELGLTAVWLVGVWQRSPASRAIKRRCGNPRAEASAYAISDYGVAEDLGGDEALAGLQEQALEHGLHIGVDVIPNHWGLDSRWVVEHPERFLSTDECPFPNYTFEGEDLSADPEIGIYLEDHYYDRSDAAVVFRRLDRSTGRETFLYHGNDGTTMPWNDTAQLDYMQPDVRKAMTDLIVDLARRYRILRFDAAMTLTRLHFQRLWFPAPGDGGAVPSRSEHGMSKQAFEHSMPTEFWSEVVTRVEQEAPDTLLLAEAFWLMEPYFVRTLGMHRVYNSAFMHLMRERENPRFQALLADTLEHDPELARRSLNFMTTPDEAPAAHGFGRDDRYFGTTALMATLPGPPLFGHGQFDGLTEQYGMDSLRQQLDETPDPAVAERHRREVAPLLRERARFADVSRLERLEFVGPGDHVWQDVYAFASGASSELRLVLFNNSAADVAGRVRAPAGSDLADLLPVEGTVLRLIDPRLDFDLEVPVTEAAGRGLPIELAPWQALVLEPAAVR